MYLRQKITLKRIVIISYTFPPSKSIGGRRWAKFAKYLDRKGYDVCVLASNRGMEDNSPWMSDITELSKKGKINYIENNYPEMINYPETIVDKLKYRWKLYKLKSDIKGNYYDSSFYWQKEVFLELKKKLLDGYDTVLATGAPFQYLYYMTQWMGDFPDVKFVADIRDPWANNKTGYGFEVLTPKRLADVLHFEEQVVSQFDHVVTVYEETTAYFKNRSLGKTKFHTIANGYDMDDFKNLNFAEKKESDKIKFVLTGSLYDKAMHIFESFVAALKELKSSDPKVFDSFQFDFYGRENNSHNRFFEDPIARQVLHHHGLVTIDEVYQNIHKADVCLLFLTDDMTYSKSTKYFEYVAMRRKIAVFSLPGEAGREVEEKNIGYALNPGRMKQTLIQIYNDKQDGKLAFPKEFDPSPYDVTYLLDDYLKIIEDEN